MKIAVKAKYIRYRRYYENDFCPGSLWGKGYVLKNKEIQIDYVGIYDNADRYYKKSQPRDFLVP